MLPTNNSVISLPLYDVFFLMNSLFSEERPWLFDEPIATVDSVCYTCVYMLLMNKYMCVPIPPITYNDIVADIDYMIHISYQVKYISTLYIAIYVPIVYILIQWVQCIAKVAIGLQLGTHGDLLHTSSLFTNLCLI